MPSDNKDILFSSLGGIEVKADERVEQSYTDFAEAFNRIASAINGLIESEANEDVNSEDTSESEGLESSIARILRNENEEVSDLQVLKNLYNTFLDNFQSFLIDNESLLTELFNRGLNIEDLYFYPRYRRLLFIGGYEDDTLFSTYGLQFIGCSYLIVDRLWDVYRCFTSKSNILEFAYDGCKLMGYTWKDYFRTLLYIPKAPFLFIEAVMSFTAGIPMIGKKVTSRFTHIEQVGAAFSEFPYEYNHSGTVRIFPCPQLSTMTEKLKNLYSSKELKLKLDDAYGLSIALFDYKFTDHKIRCVSFAGTRLGITSSRKRKVMVQNVLTDIFQYFNGPSATYFSSVEILNEITLSYPKGGLYVFGHSLGGGLMQYTCAALNCKRLHGYGYNSAGLSDNTMKSIPHYKDDNLDSKIFHICALHDPVSRLGHQIGVVKYVKSRRGWFAHSLDNMNKSLNGQAKYVLY